MESIDVQINPDILDIYQEGSFANVEVKLINNINEDTRVKVEVEIPEFVILRNFNDDFEKKFEDEIVINHKRDEVEYLYIFSLKHISDEKRVLPLIFRVRFKDQVIERKVRLFLL